MQESERKQHIQRTFDTVCNNYDCESLRFFTNAAAHLPEVFAFEGDEHVLDIATGTGIPALAMAPHLPRGRITALDFSAGMLQQAARKFSAAGLHNIDTVQMDMTAMTLPEAAFDALNCSFGLFFIERMEETLGHFASRLKPGGTLVTTHFKAGAFSPMTDLFLARVEAYGLPSPPAAWLRVASEEQNRALFTQAGLEAVETRTLQVGYPLRDAEAWWEIVWNAGYRGMIASLDDTQMACFQQEHLQEVGALATEQGIALDIEVIITRGQRPN